MHGAAVREDAYQLVVGHARPVPHMSGVEVNEGRARRGVESDAAALQAKSGKTDFFERHAGNEEIHRVAEHVLAESRDAGVCGAAAKHGIGGRGAVGGDDFDRLLGVDIAVDLPEDVEEMTIHGGLLLAAPVAEMSD